MTVVIGRTEALVPIRLNCRSVPLFEIVMNLVSRCPRLFEDRLGLVGKVKLLRQTQVRLRIRWVGADRGTIALDDTTRRQEWIANC